MMDFRDNLQKCQEYINALEEERKKIHVFQRELPLCLELVTQAIDACKKQLSGTAVTTECFNGHSECSEQTTSDGPAYEEFIPLKRSNSTDDDEELESNKPQINNNLINTIDKSGKKSDWLRSVQLWNQTPDPPTPLEDHQPKKVAVVEVKRNGNGGAFHPFQKEKSISENGNVNDHQHIDNNNNNINDDHNIGTNNKNNNKPPTSTTSACSSAHNEDVGPTSGGSGSGGGGSKKEDKGGQSQRKARRCWSPELHRRFVHALQQLGGSHVATPKQIRDLMKVDGLTNDEVKSHLQKYRLHTRRPSSGVHNNGNTQAPQFVVVGGIWMPPSDYNTVSAATDMNNSGAPPSSIYAPIATVATPPAQQTSTMVTHTHQHKQSTSQSHCEERASHSEGRVRSNSPATSSSTHTTTASHAH
ncbi:Transcription factor HHO3 [Bienertia sinuspersici]